MNSYFISLLQGTQNTSLINGRCGLFMYFPTVSVWLPVVVMMNLQISGDLIFESYLLSVGQFGTLSSKCLACVKDLVKVSDNLYIVVVVVDIFLWTTVKFVVVCVDCVKWSKKCLIRMNSSVACIQLYW